MRQKNTHTPAKQTLRYAKNRTKRDKDFRMEVIPYGTYLGKSYGSVVKQYS